MNLVAQTKTGLRRVANRDKAKILARFFKTGKGEYGEGDKFLGVVVPEQRKIAKHFAQGLSLVSLQKLLQSPWHEERLVALLILVELYRSSTGLDQVKQKQIFNFYLENISQINNWDLVDLSAPNIVGDYLFNYYSNKKEVKKFLLELAQSKNVWSRRVAVLATFIFIKNKQFAYSLELTRFLLFKQKEKHDLIHKALGWMLREIGKRDQKVLEKFLNKHIVQLPRVTFRYAIERFTDAKRSIYLKR